jgi:hypothetical protein
MSTISSPHEAAIATVFQGMVLVDVLNQLDAHDNLAEVIPTRPSTAVL